MAAISGSSSRAISAMHASVPSPCSMVLPPMVSRCPSSTLPAAAAATAVPQLLSPTASSCKRASAWHAISAQPRVVVCRGQPGLVNLPLDRDLDEPLPGFDSIASALKDLAAGKFVVVLDDENRENEGDLIMSADQVTTEAMAYMVEYTSGVICISMEGKDLERLKLPLMVSSAENEEAMYTAFTVTVDLKDGISTGISAEDRAKTIRHLANPKATAAEFRRPGHIFPLRYREGGVLVRPGHTEAGVDLARLAGSFPAGVLCEIVNKKDGSMARTPELMAYAKEHGLKCITIADLIRYRLRHEQLVQLQGVTVMESAQYGKLHVHTYSCVLDGAEHVAFVAGSTAQQPVPVYVHQERCVGDVLQAGQGASAGLHSALQQIAAAGRGVVLYMRPRLDGQPSLASELQATHGASQRMDIRVFGIAAQMLADLGIKQVSILGGDTVQATALQSCGLQIVSQQPMYSNGLNGLNGLHAASPQHEVAVSRNGALATAGAL